MEPITLDGERAALERARAAVAAKIERLDRLAVVAADETTADYIDAVVRGAIDTMRQELVTFGRVDDDHPWRIGLYGIDDGAGEQLVVDWRAPFAARFYQAAMGDPMDLQRRVSYVGTIDDLFVEDFTTGDIAGQSPLMAELSRSRGEAMRAAVATLQSEQDELIRLPPTDRLVVRGGPGTGKTVVGLHRAAWLTYNDTRVTADRLLVVGPSDRFLRFVASILPTLGETRVFQTTFASLFAGGDRTGSSPPPVAEDPRWLEVLDAYESSMLRPAELKVRHKRVPVGEVEALVERVLARNLPWKERRRIVVDVVTRQTGQPRREVAAAVDGVFPSMTARRAWAALRRRSTLVDLDAPEDLVEDWMATERPPVGALFDEVRARFDGVPATYAHVIVDEAQDLSLLQLRAVLRRADGFTLVGDDAQRSRPHALTLADTATRLGARTAEMTTAYRMSAEIADWLNAWSDDHGLDALHLHGVRPTGVPVRVVDVSELETAVDDARSRWANVARIAHDDVWDHKGVEYDAVIVDTRDMSPSEVYLAASRAAHELTVAAPRP